MRGDERKKEPLTHKPDGYQSQETATLSATMRTAICCGSEAYTGTALRDSMTVGIEGQSLGVATEERLLESTPSKMSPN